MLTKSEKSDYHFLVVDDLQLMTKLIRGILKAGGYEKVVFAETGRQALSILRKFHIDFIITDWNMPNISGIELLRLIKQNPAYCTIPVLMITMEITKEKIIFAFEEGADGYLIKPVTHNNLLASIERIINDNANPNSLKNKLKVIKRLNLQKKYDKALILAQELFMENEDNEALFAISECYFYMKNYDDAAEHARKALKMKRDDKTLNLLGKICLAQNKYDEALEYFKESSEFNPFNIDRKIQIGSVYLKLGLMEEAEELFDSFDKNEISDLNKIDIAAAYISIGDILKASKYLEENIDPIPETISVFNNYAMELRKAGNYEECIKQYDKCLKVEPENHSVIFNLGVVYFEMKQYQKAKKRIEESLKLKPDFNIAKKLLDCIKNQS